MANVPSRVLDVIHQVALAHNVSVDDLLGPRRFQKFVNARAEAAWRVRALRWAGGWNGCPSYPQLARWFNRDHTTMILLVRRWSELVWLSTDDIGPVDEAAFVVDPNAKRESMAA